MDNNINIIHPRRVVNEALQRCLDFANFEKIKLFDCPSKVFLKQIENDINLVDTSVLATFLNLQQGDIPFSILVSSDNDPNIAEALYAGALSFINISKGPAQFVNHVELIVENKVDEPSQLLRNILMEKHHQPVVEELESYNLTNREKDILKMMREGIHLKQIANMTDTTYETVRTHIKRIYKKLGVMSASEAVIKAMKMKL